MVTKCCLACGKPFHCDRNQRHCSPACRNRYKYERTKARALESDVSADEILARDIRARTQFLCREWRPHGT